jgi:hypothetical protein
VELLILSKSISCRYEAEKCRESSKHEG